MEEANRVTVICGPTATGKSDLAQDIAKERKGCILSADSMQVYRGMDIGTAKVPQKDRTVPYFGIDIVNPSVSYSAALYQDYARTIIASQQADGIPTVMVGGTGLYIQAVIDDLRFPSGSQKDNLLRNHWQAIADEEGAQKVWEMLNHRDAESAREIHPNNLKRVIRALEMLEEGESYAKRSHSLKTAKQLQPAIFLGLTMLRSDLYNKVNQRVDQMREAGLVQEVQRLVACGLEGALTSKQAIGYKEILDALHGRYTMDEAFDQIKQATRRYAKRQMTWFKRDARITWIDVTGKTKDDVREEALQVLGSL